MSSSTSTTRISDLPENQVLPSFLESVETKPSKNIQSAAPIYQQLDVHPNPYGVPKPNAPIDFSQPPPQQYLPSRDIPQVPSQYMQDEQIQTNYIPRPTKLTSDFVMENAELDRDKWIQHKQHSYRSSKLDQWVEEFQIPVLLGVLFFLFQTTLFQNLFHSYLSSLPLFDADGSINTYGVLVKSGLFALAYYGFGVLEIV
jgi:hypothetical protein